MALDFLILYEHIVREFENDCLLMAELRRRGHSVELMQLMSRKKLKYYLWKKPKVIVPSAMYDNETLNSFVYNNVGKLQKVVNLHWEEVLSREQEESTFYSLTENAAKCTHICWGDAAKARIMGNGVPEKNAVVTGALQLDFLTSQFDAYDKSRAEIAAEYSLPVDKNWILYISSFTAASMDDKEIEELNEMTDLDFKGFQQVGRRSMQVTLEWLDRLLTDRPDNMLIYRPHPSEWQSAPLRTLEKKHRNFRVIADYPVRQWIKIADRIFTWMSTSVAEIYFSGKNCLVLRPEPLYDDYDPVVYESCDAVDNYDELLGRFDHPPESFPLDENLVRMHYDVVDGTPAYMRICDLLEEVLENPPRDLPFSEGYTPRFNLLKFIALIGLNLMVTFRINPRWFRFLFGRRFTDQAARLMGYIQKSRMKKKDMKAKIAELSAYLTK